MQGLAEVIMTFDRKRMHFYMLTASIGSIPFSTQTNRYFIIAWSVLTVANIKWPALPQDLRKNSRILLLGIIAILNLAGLLYTSDMKDGFALLERTAITLVIPLLILMVPPSKRDRRQLLYFFTFVCLAVMCYCLLYAVWRIYDAGSLINSDKISDRQYYYFMNNELTSSAMNISPIYLGLYLNLCIAFLMVETLVKTRDNRKNILLLCGLHICQLFVFSLSAVLTLSVMWVIIILNHISSKKKIPSLRLTIFIVLAALTCVIFTYKIKPIHDRIFVNLEYKFENAHISYWNGVTFRLAVWQCAWEAAKNTPLIGNGTGDVDQTLTQYYQQKSFVLAEILELDAHSQYLESYLMHGLIGIISILLILLMPLYHGIKESNWLLILVVVMLSVGFVTESLLTVQKGIVLISIFFPLLYLPPHSNEKDFNRYSMLQ